MTLFIRRYRHEDANALAELFFHAVHVGAAHAYSPEERAAWAPRPPRGPDWTTRLGDNVTLVADTAEGLRGFMTLTRDGYLDLAFVHPSTMGSGLAGMLYRALEAEAAFLGVACLSTDASHPARVFFTKHGWATKSRQQVERNGITLTNFRMEKELTGAA